MSERGNRILGMCVGIFIGFVLRGFVQWLGWM